MAPSVSPAELPAVTRPPARNGVGRSAMPSIVVSGRRNSSRSATRQPSSEKTVIGTTVSRMTPFCHAAASRWCERTANASASSFVSCREAVVEVLGRRAHRHRGRVDEPLGDEARVEVDLLAHRVVAHVLDAAREHDVGGAEGDLAGGRSSPR